MMIDEGKDSNKKVICHSSVFQIDSLFLFSTRFTLFPSRIRRKNSNRMEWGFEILLDVLLKKQH